VLTACAITLAAEMIAAPPVGAHRPGHYSEILLALFSASVLLLAACARSPRRAARVIAGLVALGALALLATPLLQYSDAHALCGVLVVGALLSALAPTYARVRTARFTPHAFAVMLIASALIARLVEPLHPGWRSSAEQFGRFEPPVAQLLRHIVDLDRDSFSGIAWGGDCDDLDSGRNPLVRERTPGEDHNCNGIPLPAHDTDEERGLASTAGNPDLPAGAVDVVLLVTIDCLRYDAFTPEVMPSTLRLGEHGVAFRRAYAGGSRTHVSFPLIQRGSDDAEPVATRLLAHGVHSVAVLSFNDDEVARTDRVGFDHVVAPEGSAWWNANRITDEAITALRASAGPTYLWVHYIDAHDPRRSPPSDVPEVHGPHLDALYLRELAWIDRELGRLVTALDDTKKRAVIVVTGDHGEGLGAHGVPYHGLSAYEELVRVPAILVAPGLAPGAYDGLVSHRDLPATVLGAFGFAGVEPDVERFGRSWLRLREAPDAPLHEFVVARSDRTLTLKGFVLPQAGLVEGDRKLVKTFEDGLTELYDLSLDPGEQESLDPGSRDGVTLTRQLEMYRDIDHYP
jgi:hypothetical protein